MSPLHQSDLVPEWYDLDRGVAHLGQGVVQLSQVLSFLAEVIVPCLPMSFSQPRSLLARVPIPSCLSNTLCHSFVLSLSHLSVQHQPAAATCLCRGLSQPAGLEMYHLLYVFVCEEREALEEEEEEEVQSERVSFELDSQRSNDQIRVLRLDS